MQCDIGRPSCSKCLADGVACVYSPAKPRKSKAAEEPQEAPESGDAETANGEVEIPHEESEGLVAAGFHDGSTGPPTHQPLHHAVNEHHQFDGHLHQTAHPAVEAVPETPSAAFNQGHDVYHHSSGLSLPGHLE